VRRGAYRFDDLDPAAWAKLDALASDAGAGSAGGPGGAVAHAAFEPAVTAGGASTMPEG
jgi:hypothetical protein